MLRAEQEMILNYLDGKMGRVTNGILFSEVSLERKVLFKRVGAHIEVFGNIYECSLGEEHNDINSKILRYLATDMEWCLNEEDITKLRAESIEWQKNNYVSIGKIHVHKITSFTIDLKTSSMMLKSEDGSLEIYNIS